MSREHNKIAAKMKQLLLASMMLLLVPLTLYPQASGSYLTLSGGLGSSGFQYDLERPTGESGSRNNKLGWQAHAGYSYYFTRHFGLSASLGVSYYKTVGRFSGDFKQGEYYNLGYYTDDDDISGNQRDYELRVRFQDWREEQRGFYFEIPVLAMFQHKFDPEQRNGIYAGAGVKFQFPLSVKYKVVDGSSASSPRLNVSGYYEDYHLELGSPGDPQLAQHGYGSIHNPNATLGWNGKASTKMSIALTGEAGILIGMSPRTDLMIGGYIDYGLTNIKKKGKDRGLVEGPENQYHPEANGQIGKGITYNGMINSNATGDVKLLSYGGKLGVRVKLGKLPEKTEDEDKDKTKRIKLSEGENDILKERIYFALNSSELDFKAQEVLDRKVQLMEKYPDMKMLILGNTCNLGNNQINAALGLRRANAAKRYMMAKGIAEERLSTLTQSSDDPLVANDSEDHRASNRRADFDIDIR